MSVSQCAMVRAGKVKRKADSYQDLTDRGIIEVKCVGYKNPAKCGDPFPECLQCEKFLNR